jgi:cytochrome P450
LPWGAVVITRYDDVARTLRSNAFSRDVEANALERDDPVTRRRRDRRARGAKTILNLDPPDHTRLRRLVCQAFTPTSIERLRPSIQSMVDVVLDRAADRGSMELIDELAFPVPFRVISELLDMPIDRADELRDWSQAITAAIEPMATHDDLDTAEAALAQLIPYLVTIIEERRSSPGDDLLSALLAVEEAGERLSPAELISFVVLLYVAGHETTVNLIGNGVLALLRHRDQLALWRDDPTIDERAVDELLRYDGPVQHTVRVAMAPVSYAGAGDDFVDVLPGETVLTVLGAANHDPAVFDDPHALQLVRPNANRHLAFGAGIHYCLGASLARLETRVSLEEFGRRFPRYEVREAGAVRVHSVNVRGFSKLPVALG